MEKPTDTNSFERALGRLEGKMDSMVNSVNALASSFESLEKGRLSRLEIKVAEIVTESNQKTKNTASWVAALVALLVAVIPQLIFFLIKKP